MKIPEIGDLTALTDSEITALFTPGNLLVPRVGAKGFFPNWVGLVVSDEKILIYSDNDKGMRHIIVSSKRVLSIWSQDLRVLSTLDE